MPRGRKPIVTIPEEDVANIGDDELAVGDIVYKGDSSPDEWPADITIVQAEHMGYQVVYDRKTREPSKVLRSLLPHMLRMKNPDGSLRFTTRRPQTPPYRGTLKCYLHPDSPDRERYDRMGFVVCEKSNLVSETERERHMQVRHSMAWRSIQAERTKAEQERQRQEERDFQERMAALQLETLKAVMAQREK